jgi:hypothetical protein
VRRKLLASVLIATFLFTMVPFSGVLANGMLKPPTHGFVNFSAPAGMIQTIPGTQVISDISYYSYKTVGEELNGNLGSCPGLSALSGAAIKMQVTSYFNMDSVYNLDGFSYATVTISVPGGSMTMFAIGAMDGNYLSSADTVMYWAETYSSGSLAQIRGAFGQIEATFNWHWEYMEYPAGSGNYYPVYLGADAEGILSGTYFS